MGQANGSYLMANNTIILNYLPQDEANIERWANNLAAIVNATVREAEIAADQYCWRLSIDHKHWLLTFSFICESAWLEPLEEADPEVSEALRDKGYLG